MKPEIRRFRKKDRTRVREIAISTASGYPRCDLQLVADLITDYYLIYEPEHLLIAEAKGEVAGYLTGCFNTSRCRWIKTTRVVPKALFKAVLRGEIGRKEIKYSTSLVYVTLNGEGRSRPPSGYPAHFHVNLAEDFRGKGIGSKLVEKFFALLEDAGIEGVHVRVRQSEKGASRFFRSFGFSRENAYPTVVAGEGEIRVSRSIIYTKDL